MLRFTIMPIDDGFVGIVASPRGLTYLSMSKSQGAAEDRVRREFPTAERDNDLMPEVRVQLGQYFAGKAVDFDVTIDLSPLTDFQRKVLSACAKIPRGQVLSYAELARRLNRPRAARAVGNALARNPIPVVIPCHRVIASNGQLGGYSAEQGLNMKRRLLELECASPSITVDRDV